MHEEQQVAYFSKALACTVLSISTYEWKLMALVLAMQHWLPYLISRNTLLVGICTDHHSLKHLLAHRIET